jgi:uncharacterized protein YycO
MLNILRRIGITVLATAGIAALMSSSAWASMVRGEVTVNEVNIRAEGSRSSDVLYMVDRGQPVDILEVSGDYYKINLNLDSNLYIASEYVEITEIIGTVIVDNTALLDKPLSAGGAPVTTVNSSFAVNVQFYDEEGWYIDYAGTDYFIEKPNLTVPAIVPVPMKSTEGDVIYTNTSFVESGNTVDDIISYAKNYLGTPYRYGGRSSKGFDCSGFVSYVLGHFGISVSRSSASMANNGTAVDRSELQKGDLLFFATTRGRGRVSHVGMYIGNGQFIHSSTWGKGVVITDLNDDYYTRCFVKAKRVL